MNIRNYKSLAWLIIAVMLFGLMPAIATAEPVEPEEVLYLVDSADKEDGESILFKVSLDEGTSRANLKELYRLPYDQVDAVACYPDGPEHLIYAIDKNTANMGVYNVATTDWTTKGSVGLTDSTTIGGIVLAAFSPDGRLFVASQDDSHFYEVDTNTAIATDYGPAKIGTTVLKLQGADFAFDSDGNLFVWTNSNSSQNKGLYEVDKANVITSNISAVYRGGFEDFFTGLAIREDGEGDLVGSNTNDDTVVSLNKSSGGEIDSYDMYEGGNPYAYTFGDMTAGPINPPEPKTYEICGYKYDYYSDEGLEGWRIELEKWNVDDWEYLEETETDSDGHYCFEGLLAGKYRVNEVDADGWEQMEPGIGGYEVMLPSVYGVERNTGKIHQIDPETGYFEEIFTSSLTNIPSSNNKTPNGLAVNPENGYFYYVDYFNMPTNLYSAKPDGSDETNVALLSEEIACADFFSGAYYYIDGGPVDGGSDDLYKVTFNPDGTVAFNGKVADISGNASAWTFGGDIAISEEGRIYGWGSNGGDYEFFSVDTAGTNYEMIDVPENFSLQLAFGPDGTLYGHDAASGNFYTVDLTTGEPTLIATCDTTFTDLASGSPREYNFYNRQEYCAEETAWASMHLPGDNRFVEEKGQWATYLEYEKGDGTETTPAAFPLYAGQKYLSGKLEVWDNGTTLSARYVIDDEWLKKWLLHCGEEPYGPEDVCEGEWTEIVEYHFDVANDEYGIPRTYKKKDDEYKNPIPGKFEYVGTGSDRFEVNISNLNDDFVIAAHAVMRYCGYECTEPDE